MKIATRIKTGTFRVFLKPEDWQSGDSIWLLDVIAPDRKATEQVEPEMMARMGAVAQSVSKGCK